MFGLTRASALILALAAIPSLALVAQQLPPHPSAERAAGQDAYLRLLNSVFIRNNWLVSNGRNPPTVQLSDAARQSPEAMAFYNNSPLHTDMSRADPNLWSIRNGVVIQMSPFAHFQAIPFARKDVWRGNLLFRSDRDQPLQSEIASPSGAFRLSQRVAGQDEASGVGIVKANAFRDALIGSGEALELWPGPVSIETPPLVRIVLAGDTPLLRVTGAQGSAVLDGRTLRLGDSAALQPGSQLELKRGRSSVVLVARGAAADVVSVTQPLSDRYRAAGLDRFAKHVEAGLNEAVSQGFPADRDVRLSLDGALQTRLQALLDAYCQPHGRFRAAMTVMDANTGEILALASYPGEDTRRADEDQDRRDLERNQNFYALPVGSAAKVPISAAILAEHPELATLQVRPGPLDITSIMGVSLPAITDEASLAGERIGFEQFLKYSSNRFATALMILGSAPHPQDGRGPPTGSDTYWLDGRERTALPQLPFAQQAGAGGVVLGAPEGKLQWPGRLHDLFDVDYEAPRTGARPDEFGDDSSDMLVWRDLLSDPSLATGDAPPIFADLRDVSPDREVFATNRITSFRSEYVQMILGSQGFAWTNIRLAEAYARVVTGRAVEPTLIQRVGRWPPPAPLEALPLSARQTIMSGMRQVTDPHGTADALAPGLRQLRALAPGQQIDLWGKTGTPRLELPVLLPRQLAENDLIRAGVLQLRSGRIVLQLSGRTLAPEDRLAAAALRKDRTASAILDHRNVRPGEVLARASRYNSSPGPGLFEISNGVLVQVHGADGLSKQRDPKVFVFVVAVGAEGAGQPKRALSIAINIEQRWIAGNNESVVFARCILPSVLAPVLLGDPRAVQPMDGACHAQGLR